jgi:futalosine hydrolase
MAILICAATEAELEPVRHFVKQQKIGNKVQLLVTGVGVVAATYALTKFVCSQRPTLILQGGVAGCFDENMALGTTVVVQNESIADLGVFQDKKFTSLFELGLADEDTFPWKNGKLYNVHAHTLQTGLPMADSITVNEITTNNERILHYKNKLGAVIESMEGAALHYVALMESVPFLQIRSISNYIGERDKSKWLLKKAIGNLNQQLERLLKKFIAT